MLTLYLIRHGKADPESPTGRDEDRPLLPRGERQALRLGPALSAMEFPPSLLVVSPTLRARQTAARLLDSMAVPLLFDEGLRVDRPVSALLDVLDEHLGERAVALIGHNPQLQIAAATLTGGPGAPAPEVRTGQALVLTLDPERSLIGSAKLVDSLRFDD